MTTEIAVVVGVLVFALLHMLHTSTTARRSVAAVLAILEDDRANSKKALDEAMRRERELLSALVETRMIQPNQVNTGRYKLPTGEPAPVNGRILIPEGEG